MNADVIENIEPEMIHIPAGKFLMGSDKTMDILAGDDETPQHEVYVADYWISKSPITNVQYQHFMDAKVTRIVYAVNWNKLTRKYLTGMENHPVACLNWNDSLAYCNWLVEQTGKAYRLPTEAEWEKMARGTDGRIWPWGNEFNIRYCYHSLEDTYPVGKYSSEKDSTYGCIEIVGTVKEWVSSLYKPYPYAFEDGREDLEAPGQRVMRGGGSYSLLEADNEEYSRCASRDSIPPEDRQCYFGFRCALS